LTTKGFRQDHNRIVPPGTVLQAQGAQLPAPHATGVDAQHPVVQRQAACGPVAEQDIDLGGGAVRHFVPCEVARRCDLRLGAEFHFTQRRAKAQAREGVDDGADAFMSAKPVIPQRRVVAAHVAKEFTVAYRRFGFARQFQGAFHCPAGQHTRMHHQPLVAVDDLKVRKLLLSDPVEQQRRIFRVEHFVKGIARMWLAVALRAGEHEEVVIAEHRHGRITQGGDQPQRVGRLRATIDQVTDEPKAVAACVEVDRIEHHHQLVAAALHVADGPGAHAG
jgi:hypothetical protein